MLEYGLKDVHDIGFLGEGCGGDAEEALELLQGDGDGRSRHEPHDRGVGQVIDDEAEPAGRSKANHTNSTRLIVQYQISCTTN